MQLLSSARAWDLLSELLDELLLVCEVSKVRACPSSSAPAACQRQPAFLLAVACFQWPPGTWRMVYILMPCFDTLISAAGFSGSVTGRALRTVGVVGCRSRAMQSSRPSSMTSPPAPVAP